jgi:Fe-S cluster assembly ATPase SufC
MVEAKMNITPDDIYKILEEEVQSYLEEVELTDHELNRLLRVGMKGGSEKAGQEVDSKEMLRLLGPDGIKDVMVALAQALGDKDLVDYTKAMR